MPRAPISIVPGSSSPYPLEFLSGSTDGRQIKVAATATPGTTIHTATSDTEGTDAIWLWANNTSGATVVLTLELGGTTSPDDLIVYSVRAGSGLNLILPGLILNNGVVVKAFAGTINVLTVVGYVEKRDQ